MRKLLLVFGCFSLLAYNSVAQTANLENGKGMFFDILREALSSPIVERAIAKQRKGEVYPLYLVYDHSFSNDIEMEGFAIDSSKIQPMDFSARNSVLQVSNFEYDPTIDAFRLRLLYNQVVSISIKASRTVKQNGKRISSILISTD